MLHRKARRKSATKHTLGRVLGLVLCILSVQCAGVYAADSPDKLTPQEAERLNSLRKRLCSSKQLSCDYVDSIFEDARLTIYEPPAPSVSQGPSEPQRQANPYLTARFGLLTTESLERCRSFIQAHLLAFDAAYHIYGVPREVICGHLRIETDFGIPTKLSPHPLGTIPAINRLVSLYVRKPSRKQPRNRFVHRQAFALEELKDLLHAGSKFG